MSKLTDFKLLSLDVYGTLIDWESGILEAIRPIQEKSDKTDLDRQLILQEYSRLEMAEQQAHPTKKYCDILTTIFPALCSNLGLQHPTAEESIAFGNSIGSWPPFPDTISALARLSKTYKLAVLSNVDNASLHTSIATSLSGHVFDALYTAEQIGSYKPDPANFSHLLARVDEQFGLAKHDVLHTAQSQIADHYPAKESGFKTAWIERQGSAMGLRGNDQPVWDWRFGTLGEMADAVEEEEQQQQ